MGSNKLNGKNIIKKYFGSKEIIKEVFNGAIIYESPIYGIKGLYQSDPTLMRTDDSNSLNLNDSVDVVRK